MFLGAQRLVLVGRRSAAGYHGGPGVLLTCPQKRGLEQCHLYSGTSDEIGVTGGEGRPPTDQHPPAPQLP